MDLTGTFVFRVKEVVLEPIELPTGRVIQRGDPVWLTAEEASWLIDNHPGAIYPADNRAATWWELEAGKKI